MRGRNGSFQSHQPVKVPLCNWNVICENAFIHALNNSYSWRWEVEKALFRATNKCYSEIGMLFAICENACLHCEELVILFNVCDRKFHK